MWALEVFLTNYISVKLRCWKWPQSLCSIIFWSVLLVCIQLCCCAVQIHAKLTKMMTCSLEKHQRFAIFEGFECVCLIRPFPYRWGSVAMLCTGRYCTCPGLCRNEEMEDVQDFVHIIDGFQIIVIFKPLKYSHISYLCTFLYFQFSNSVI